MDLRTDRWWVRLGSGESGRSSPLSSPPQGSSWSWSSRAESTNHPPSGNSSTLYSLSPAVCQVEDNQRNVVLYINIQYIFLCVASIRKNLLYSAAFPLYHTSEGFPRLKCWLKFGHVTHFSYQVESVLPPFHFPLVLLLCLFKSHLLGKAWTRGGLFGSWRSLLMEVIKPVSEWVLCILQTGKKILVLYHII